MNRIPARRYKKHHHHRRVSTTAQLEEMTALVVALSDAIVANAKELAIDVGTAPEQWAEYVTEDTFELLKRAGLDL